MFGLVQGGIVPSYAIIMREDFPAREAGSRVGIVIMATIFGMAFGGWISGAIFDLTGSYRAAFLHGIAWNVAELRDRVVAAAAPRHGRAPGAGPAVEGSRRSCYVVKITTFLRATP